MQAHRFIDFNRIAARITGSEPPPPASAALFRPLHRVIASEDTEDCEPRGHRHHSIGTRVRECEGGEGPDQRQRHER
jgi:hypothetical protein